MKPKILSSCVILLAVAACQQIESTARAAVSFSVTPSAVSNLYAGTITLQIGGLNAGETVQIDKFLDANSNGVIDAADLPVQSFLLTDGQASVFYDGTTAVTNINVPGDFNPTNGVITAQLRIASDLAQQIVAQYIFRLSSPTSRFTPTNTLFNVTNSAYAQSFTGAVRYGGANVPNVVVMAGPGSGQNRRPLAGVMANNSGNYTLNLPGGTYGFYLFKSNFVADLSQAPLLTLTNGTTFPTNLTFLIPATNSISGRLVDATNTNTGLPDVFMTCQTLDKQLMAGACYTGTNGAFTVPVIAGQWKVSMDSAELAAYGYLDSNGHPQVDTTTGSVSSVILALPKATALFYGSVSNSQSHPLAGIDIYCWDDNNQYEADYYTDTNGYFVAPVVGGSGNDRWQVEVSSDTAPTNYIFSEPSFNQNGGTNLSAGQARLVNFTALLATNQIAGTVNDNFGNPIVGVGVSASTSINGTNYQTYIDTDQYGHYSLNVANGSWNVGLYCGDGGDGLQGLGNYQCANGQTIMIANNNGLANFTVQANINVGGPLQVMTGALPNGTVGAAYDQQLTADGGHPSLSYSWSVVSGSLPPGLSMDWGGTIQGTPTLSGASNFTVQVSDNNGSNATRALSLTINSRVLQVTTTSLSSGTTNVAYNSQQLTASGGQPPYIWSLASGALPPGLSLSTNGVISGTPTTAGTSNFVVRVTDNVLATATQALSLVVYTFSTSVTFTVTPPAVSNFYTGIITLQVGKLISGETVLVEKFRDDNGNGVINAGDTEVQQFQLTDGQASVFYDGTSAVTNFNVPGDLTPADGAITAQLPLALSGAPQLTVAQYAFRLSSPTGQFAPITNLFNVTNSAYAQSFTGNVVCGTTNVPHALAYLLTPAPNMTVIAGTLADGAGGYRLNAPPGTYLLWAFKNGFVADAGNGPVLALGANATITTNLSLLPPTCSISGRFVDAANTSAGLPRVNVKASVASKLVTLGWTDGDGNFALSATTNGWAVWGDNQNLDSQGFLGLQARTHVNTTTGSVAGVTIALARGTALVYGTVKDAQNHPLAGVRLSGNQNYGAGPYVGDATTDQNGNYAMAVNNAGVWNAGISANNPAFTNYTWSAGLGDTGFANGQAVRQDFIGTVTNQGLFLTAPAWLGNGEFQFTFNTQSNVNYTIQYSTTLMNWISVLTFDGDGGPLTIIDPNAAGSSRRFYRVKIRP